MLNERNRAVLLAVKPKPFEGKPTPVFTKPQLPANKRYKVEPEAMAMVEWESIKSQCVLLKGEKR